MRRLIALVLVCGTVLGTACESTVTERYAPLARPFSRYLALTKIRIADVAAMMEREELRVPVHTGPYLSWETPLFRWWNEWWRGQRLDEHLSSRYSTNDGGNLDSVIALFDVDVLDEGWFELRCPRGQVPGRAPGMWNVEGSHLEPGALRVNAGVPYDTAARGFREFRAAPQAFVWFLTGDPLTLPPPSTAALWRYFAGFAVHPRSPHREELQRQIERGRRVPLRFVQERDFYRELAVVPFD